ncbi:class I SAM-dependent methyltransferase [Legionella sp. W05-934-2]|uniref:class I SAM-dependent methyltransferase n=1 Tax=Legionella sp. W05-934-2 TaxID=1198649 RepID=UPI0034632EB3
MIISHGLDESIDLDSIKERISKNPTPILPIDVELQLAEELVTFPLGQFLLKNKGLNGFWTAYMILHGPKEKNLSPLESWIVHQSPGFKATQQRFAIFQRTLQGLLSDNCHLASVPCGLMDDLLRLDFSSVKNCQLTGIDLDEESLSLAEKNAKNLGIKHVSFLKKDAWQLAIDNQFDAITSNGLNIYEPKSNRVIDLYRQFYKALKPKGHLVTSFITPPPTLSSKSSWKIDNLDNFMKQAAIFTDIIQAGWQCFRSESETHQQLEEAGFSVKKVIYDEQCIFPTIVAQKLQ